MDCRKSKKINHGHSIYVGAGKLILSVWNIVLGDGAVFEYVCVIVHVWPRQAANGRYKCGVAEWLRWLHFLNTLELQFYVLH